MKRLLSLMLLVTMVFTVSCGEKNPSVTSDDTTLPAETTAAPDDTIASPDTSDTSDTPAGPVEPEYINPLTGLATTKELASQRPVAIMLNNIKVATPQDGISSADVIYECLAEGGITRLMMLTQDYSALGVVGSIRSARDYFVELSQNHDAIFVHAGGSPDAYTEIFERNLDYLDFVNGKNVDPYYYRDEWRMNNMGYVHSVVTTGSRLANAFTVKNFRTEISTTYTNPFKFVQTGKEVIPADGIANKVTIPHSIVQTSSFVYDAERNVYDHYQFSGILHTDRLNGEKVSTANVILLFMDQNLIPGDEAYRINVDTVGTGDGVYLYGGKYVSIKWSKADKNSEMVLTYANGTSLEINRGKTFISIVDSATRTSVTVE